MCVCGVSRRHATDLRDVCYCKITFLVHVLKPTQFYSSNTTNLYQKTSQFTQYVALPRHGSLLIFWRFTNRIIIIVT